MLLADLVAVSRQVAATRRRSEKVALLADLLRRMDPGELAAGVPYLAGRMRQGRVAVGWRTVAAVEAAPAGAATLALRDVDAAVERLARAGGAGVRAVRHDALRALFRAATAGEQEFLRGLLLGDVRQGALEGLLAQAIARAGGVPEAAVRRALMLEADLGAIAQAATTGGEAALAAFRLALFRPLQPMLAASAPDLDTALDGRLPVRVEWKLDGMRVQVHRDGGRVAVYSRTRKDVTARSPGVVAAARALPATRFVLDGEVLGLRPDGRPRPFQDTMRRAGKEAALAPFFFDVLHLDGGDLLDEPLWRRAGLLEELVPEARRVPGEVAGNAAAAGAVLAAALERGHEGAMVKALDAAYEAGRRGASWQKVKPVHTLDLVVLAVEWGSGRRRGWLSNIHLGAREEERGGFVMLGKTFKGMTDGMLEWQTRRFLELEAGREGHVVHLRPEQVVEVAFDGLQRSPRYPAGLALRFARVKRYRDDKTAAEADTLATVRAIAGGALGPGILR